MTAPSESDLLIHDPVALAKAAEAWWPIRQRRLAHEAGNHRECPPHICQVAAEKAEPVQGAA